MAASSTLAYHRLAVFGATGPTGVLAVKAALELGHHVTALVRNPDKLNGIKNDNLEVVKANIFEPDSIVPHLEGKDAIVSYLGAHNASIFNPTTFYKDVKFLQFHNFLSALGQEVEDAAQNVNLPEVQNPPQGQNAPAADQNANAAGQPLECIPTMEERLKKLEDQGKANSVAMALQSLHRTLDKARFDADEALADLETLVRQAKVNNDPKAREFECVLDEVQRHSKTLSRTALKDLFVALVGDSVKSKILEKANKVLKNIGTLSDNPRPPAYNHGGPQPLMDLNNHGHPWPDRATASRRLPSWRENRRSPYARRPNMAQLTYFLCNSESHFARNCPQRTKRQ
ncbi:hypothetical protein QZH41_002607 [Actinostola sp. cb2023]|nr:hypothetical protein QZH41_002607 [Actinostola sp. cb2023]